MRTVSSVRKRPVVPDEALVSAGERASGDLAASAGQDLSVIRMEGVTKEFRGTQAVRDVSLTVERGEVVALIGPSGAGKSTLLRCINFLEIPSSGEIYINGRLVGGSTGRQSRRARERDLATVRREVGMVFQGFHLFPHLTVLENVTLGQVRSLRRTREDAEKRARSLLARVGLEDRCHDRPAKLSGGQQQRVAIARALALEPKAMLFDEPTSAIDVELRVEVLRVMRELASDGMTMVVVTHEMTFARDVADRTVFMVDGSIVEEGPSADLFNAPRTERLQAFLSAVSV